MSEYAYFYNSENGDRVYDADSFSNWLKKFFTTGVFEGDCQVTALGDMVVNLAPGYANIMGKVKELENQTFTLEPADGSYPRIDTIVIERNDTDRDITAKVVTGQLSGNTPAPTPRVWENGVYQLVVAEIYVAAGATEVTQANITDKRSDPDVCGIVAGTVTEMDFSQFTAQFESYFEQFKASNLEEFSEWFEMIKGQLSEDAAGHLQNEIDDINEILGDGLIASNINYDNTHSGLSATKVQGAIDEINDNLTWYIQNGWLPVRPSGDVPANMEDCSWAMLKSLAAAGTLGNYYQIGDTKTIELTSGERVVMELVSINDGEGTAGAYYPRGTVDFISKDCLQTTRSMNSSNTNAGGWVICALRTTLNTTIYETLPQTVKDAIVEKTHKTSAGSQSTSLVEHSDKLWLPTEYEMFGAITYSANTENANVNKHYAVFDTNADRIKHQGTNGSALVWWESSPHVSNSTNFCHVNSIGSGDSTGASYSRGVPLCFRIGQLFT